jgi:hypothetical protein
MAAPVHAELAVDDVFYQEDVFSGRWLKVIYRYRSFRGLATEERQLWPDHQRKAHPVPRWQNRRMSREPGFDELAGSYGQEHR